MVTHLSFRRERRLPLGLILLCLIAGASGALGQAPWSLWWLALAGFGAMFYLLQRATSVGQAAWVGWLCGVSYFAVAMFWIVEPFLVDIGRHGWMAPFALFFLSGGLALLWSAAFALAGFMGQQGARVLGLIVFLSAIEMLRAVLFTGLPWTLIGYIWTDHPMLQLAALGGPHLLTFITLTITGLPFLFKGNARIFGILASVFLLVDGWLYGNVVLERGEMRLSGKTVRLVQPNAAQKMKWDRAMVPVFFNRQLTLSAEQATLKPDLIIWPETAITQRLTQAEDALRAVAQAAGGAPVVLGVNDVVDAKYRNSLVVVGGEGTVLTKYAKHHLVPFGEYIPFGEMLGKFGITGLAARDGAGYDAGPGPQVIDIPGIGRALPLICYELIFPRNLRVAERPQVIIQITNDAWFGNISGPYQHLAQARVRAVEQGLPVLRAANTGISAAIDPWGRIIAQTQLNKAGFIDAGLPLARDPTPYVIHGDGPMRWLLLALLFALITGRVILRD